MTSKKLALACAALISSAGGAFAQQAIPPTYVESDVLRAKFTEATGGGEAAMGPELPYAVTATSSGAFSDSCSACGGLMQSLLLPVAAGASQATFASFPVGYSNHVAGQVQQSGTTEYDVLGAGAQVGRGQMAITVAGATAPALSVTFSSLASSVDASISLSDGSYVPSSAVGAESFTITGTLVNGRTIVSGASAAANRVLFSANGVTIVENATQPLLAQECGTSCALARTGWKSSGLLVRLSNASIGGSSITGDIAVANSLVAVTPPAGSTYPGITGY